MRKGISPGSISSCEDFINIFFKCWGPPLEKLEEDETLGNHEIEETFTLSILEIKSMK